MSAFIDSGTAATYDLFDNFLQTQTQLKEAQNHPWFAQKIAGMRLLAYLEYAPRGEIVASMQSILYAFTHPGTREGLCRLCVGLFGQQSILILDETPNTLTINITNANQDLSFSVAEPTHAVAEPPYTVAGTSLSSVVGTDPYYFFKRFLPAGVVLLPLNIS